MKKFFALMAFAAFISIQSVSAQSNPSAKVATPAAASTEEVKSESTEKSCHGSSAKASCCKDKAKAEASSKKASCCAKHEEKAEVKADKKEMKD